MQHSKKKKTAPILQGELQQLFLRYAKCYFVAHLQGLFFNLVKQPSICFYFRKHTGIVQATVCHFLALLNTYTILFRNPFMEKLPISKMCLSVYHYANNNNECHNDNTNYWNHYGNKRRGQLLVLAFRWWIS